MTQKGAFAGLKLSDHLPGAAPPAVDQRLFSPAQPTQRRQPATKKATANSRPDSVTTPLQTPATGATSAEAGQAERRSPSPSLTVKPAEATSTFDINEKPWRKDSFLFTDAEFERLEDLKTDLRRRFDLKATKNDIARAALQFLAEDYRIDPSRSAVVRHLRKKKP